MRRVSAILKNMKRLYPEVSAGGFSHIDGTVQFYTRVNALLRPDMVVLDYGAGRGAQLLDDQQAPFRRRLCQLKGKVATVCGVDLDHAVLDNPFLDDAQVIAMDERLPYKDGHFDIIVADWVLEHVENPRFFAAEINRVLKSRGWLCARTPNLWGIVGIGANLVPSSWHARILRSIGSTRREADVFPTVYKLNTLKKIRAHFEPEKYLHHSYISNSEPPYVLSSITLSKAVQIYWRIVPRSLFTNLYIFIQKN